MKMIKWIECLMIIMTFVGMSAAQLSPEGLWKNIDDEDGKAKSHIEIYKVNGKLMAKVLKLLDNATISKCTSCKGDKKNQPLEGMVILWDMAYEGDNEWAGGKIIDPKSGKDYKCKIELEDHNTLKVRGYVGMPTFGRTQYWYRVIPATSTQ